MQNSTILLLITILLTCSCSKKERENPLFDNTISFQTHISTRATIKNTFVDRDEMTISAIRQNDGATEWSSMFNHAIFRCDASGLIKNTGATSYYWPLSGKVRCYAFAPAVVTAEPDFLTTPAFTYEQPASADKMVDLLCAREEIVMPVAVAPQITFGHSLSLIKFSAALDKTIDRTLFSGDGIVIKSLRLKGKFASKAVYNLEKKSWTVVETKDDQTFDIPLKNNVLHTKDQVQVNDESGYLMMIPSGGYNASLELTFQRTLGGVTQPEESKQFVLNPSDMSWSPNKVYDYKIKLAVGDINDYSNESMQLSVTISPWGETTVIEVSDEPSEEGAIPTVKIGETEWAAANLVSNGKGGLKIGLIGAKGVGCRFGSHVAFDMSATTFTSSIVEYGTPCEWSSTTPAYFTTASSGTLPISNDICRSALGGLWRLPTENECTALLNATPATPRWVTEGCWLGPDAASATTQAPANALFFPSTGYRNNTSGSLGSEEYFMIWTSKVSSATNGKVFGGSADSTPTVFTTDQNRANGFTVRCVR